VLVYDRIRADILSGRLPAGKALVELTIAESYGVSRTPIREALLRLENDGLVERLAQGMVVRGRSPEEILEIYEARIALEGAVTAAAARRRTTLDLAKLRHTQQAIEASTPDDPDVAHRLNRAFHGAIWAAGHNGTIVDLLTRLDAHMSRYSGTTLLYPGRWKAAVSEHASIMAAIEAQDEALAERLAREHFDHAREIRLAIFASGSQD
jgi:DNA-binding GntR family transcriptional regulator